jgi:hypothetical protein
MRRVTCRLVRLGAESERGVEEALYSFSDAYVAAVDGEIDRNPQGEPDRAVAGAVAKFGGKRRRAS